MTNSCRLPGLLKRTNKDKFHLDFKINTFANTDGIIYKLATILLSTMTNFFSALDKFCNRDNFICRRDWQNCAPVSASLRRGTAYPSCHRDKFRLKHQDSLTDGCAGYRLQIIPPGRYKAFNSCTLDKDYDRNFSNNNRNSLLN